MFRIFTTCFILSHLHSSNGLADYLLPKNIVPEKYDIKIIAHLDEPPPKGFRYTGEVSIAVDCAEDTNDIRLHSKDLKIYPEKTKVTEVSSGEQYQPTNQTFGPHDFYIISFAETLKRGQKYVLELTFDGQLIDGLSGFYRSNYEDLMTGQKHWIATTQFQPYDARRAFPCFDEPALKAVFKLTMGHHRNFTALGNMPIKRSKPMNDLDDWVWDEFEETVKMSSYIVAFVVSDFISRKSVVKRKSTNRQKNQNLQFEVWSRRDAIKQVAWAQEFGPKALQFLEDYFQIPFPLPKMDMIAIPDFNAGAMENWGLVTYREADLLYDPKVSTLANKGRVSEVVAHELAHQWFGNLVTMKWWTDLWLNEGFATFLSIIVVDRLIPDWKFEMQKIQENLMTVYALDSLKSSHQISIPIGNPSEIHQIFDGISYQKGSCLLRMLATFLSENTFRDGVTNYLNKYQYSNAEQDNLMEYLTEQAYKDGTLNEQLTVKQIMDTWTLQTGYPVITVRRDCAKGKAYLKQDRFFKDITSKEKDDNCWWVPFSYTTEKELDFDNATPKLWLSCPKTEAAIDIKCNEWFIGNIGATGLYKINYDEDTWRLIIKKLMSKSYKDIPTLNRVVLIENIMSLARTGDVSYNIAFDFLDYLKQEDEYLPWETALANLYPLKVQLQRSAGFGFYKMYMKQMLTPIYSLVGGFDKNENEVDTLDTANFQRTITTFGCRYNVGDCRKQAHSIFHKYRENPIEHPIPKNLRKVVFETAVERGGEETWNFLWDIYKRSNVIAEKVDILYALGKTKEVWLLNRYLQWSLDSHSGIRSQDAYAVFVGVVSADVGQFVAESFFRNDLHALHKSLGPNEQNMARYVKGISNNLISENEHRQLEQLVNDNKKQFAKSKLGVEQALEGVNINIMWDKMFKTTVENILKEKVRHV